MRKQKFRERLWRLGGYGEIFGFYIKVTNRVKTFRKLESSGILILCYEKNRGASDR